MNRLEETFKKRYNRDTKIIRTTNEKDKTELNIISKKGTVFTIIEYRKDGATDYATVSFGEKKHAYKRYIDAEIFIADMLGSEEWQH